MEFLKVGDVQPGVQHHGAYALWNAGYPPAHRSEEREQAPCVGVGHERAAGEHVEHHIVGRFAADTEQSEQFGAQLASVTPTAPSGEASQRSTYQRLNERRVLDLLT